MGCATRSVLREQTELRMTQGKTLIYVKDELRPFTGILITTNADGCRDSEPYRNGLRNGLCRYWYPNGQLQEQHHVRNGIDDGTYEEWYESGKRKSKGTLYDGRFIGEFRAWYPNGRLRCISWVEDVAITKEEYWYPNGQKRCVRVWDNGGWNYINEWDEQGTSRTATESQRAELDSEDQ